MNRSFTIVIALLWGWLLSAAQLRGGDRDEAIAALERANKLGAAGNLEQAGPVYERALELAVKGFGSEHPFTAAVLNKLGALRRDQRKPEEAERLLLRSLTIRERAFGKNHPDVALVLDDIADIWMDQRKFALSEALYQRSLAIREKSFGKEHLAIADSCWNLGVLNARAANYAEAESQLRRCVAIRQKLLGNEHPELTSPLNNLANVCCEQGKFAEAQPLYEKALAIREKVLGKDHPALAGTLSNLAIVCQEMGEHAIAEALHLRALAIAEKTYGKDSPKMTAPLNNLAMLYVAQGKFARAEPLYERCLALDERELGRNHPAIVFAVNNLASLFLQQGKFAAVESLCLRASNINENSPNQSPLHVARTLLNLAKVRAGQDKRAEAETLFQRAAVILEQARGKEHREVADCLLSLANLLQGPRPGDALPLYQRCLQIYNKVYGPDSLSAARILNNMANLSLRQRQYEVAENLYLRSLSIFEKVNGKVHPAVASSLGNLAYVSYLRGNYAQSARWHTQLRQTMRQFLLRELPELSPEEQLAFLEMQERDRFGSALALGLCRNDDPVIVEASAAWLLNGKAIALEAQAVRQRLEREVADSDGRAVLKEIQAIRARQAAIAVRPQQRTETGTLREELETQRRELERKLARDSATAAKLANPWVELAAIRKAIPADAVFIDMARFDVYPPQANLPATPHYAAWVIPAAGAVRIVDLGEAAAIDAAVQAARRTLENTIDRLEKRDTEKKLEADAAEKLAAVAKLVFEPLKPHLGNATKLVLSPDGELWLLPWAALPAGNGRYLVEDYTLRFVVSGRNLVAPAVSRDPALTPPLILADPNFNLSPAEVAAAAKRVPASADKAVLDGTRFVRLETRGLGRARRLPGTVGEARQAFDKLKALTGQEPKFFTDAEASEALVKATRSPQTLVLATHGFFVPKQEVTQGGLKNTAETQTKEIDNPLLRCGLLLAGANKRDEAKEGEDDGVLTGLEIVGLDLRGTQLVVLSACETGLGDVQTGEGVAGLRQAFQLAGAESVLATLWQIGDKATSQLMNSFYDELATGAAPSEALTRAQRQFLKDRRDRLGAGHPYFWASFTLTGK